MDEEYLGKRNALLDLKYKREATLLARSCLDDVLTKLRFLF